MANKVNEGSTATLVLTFKDENGNEVTPTSATYRIDDVQTATEILGDTVFTPTSEYDLVITNEQNAMVSTQKSEVHEITVVFEYAASNKQWADSFLLTVENLKFLQ